mmetsp:Transcript_28070/g.77542  ORF Transcript_28070/g.77542 Transcript_28070/m.77542 type:complete len:382 (-) Transcript_28070:141-1286(-)
MAMEAQSQVPLSAATGHVSDEAQEVPAQHPPPYHAECVPAGYTDGSRRSRSNVAPSREASPGEGAACEPTTERLQAMGGPTRDDRPTREGGPAVSGQAFVPKAPNTGRGPCFQPLELKCPGPAFQHGRTAAPLRGDAPTAHNPLATEVAPPRGEGVPQARLGPSLPTSRPCHAKLPQATGPRGEADQGVAQEPALGAGARTFEHFVPPLAATKLPAFRRHFRLQLLDCEGTLVCFGTQRLDLAAHRRQLAVDAFEAEQPACARLLLAEGPCAGGSLLGESLSGRGLRFGLDLLLQGVLLVTQRFGFGVQLASFACQRIASVARMPQLGPQAAELSLGRLDVGHVLCLPQPKPPAQLPEHDEQVFLVVRVLGATLLQLGDLR